MSFDFTGHVLRAPRVATGNAQTTSEVQNGVARPVEAVPTGYVLDAAAPPLVDVRADQYRAAVLDAPGTSPVEYCVWAENSANLALRNDATWAISTGAGAIPAGIVGVTDSITGEVYAGTDRTVVTDDGSRSIGSISAVVIARGDVTYVDEGWVNPNNFLLGRAGSAPYIVVIPGAVDQDVRSGVVRLTSTTLASDGTVYRQNGGGNQILTDINGGLSLARGDLVVEVQYTVAASRFWWSRNDRYQTRFGWSDALQRWAVYKGGAILNLGLLAFGGTYTLSPRPKGLVSGADLPGDGATADAYAMIRVGVAPGATSSQPVGLNTPGGFPVGVRVVEDRAVAGYDFGAQGYAAIVGKINGILVFNPAFTELHAGKAIWYVSRDFDAEAEGVVGNLRASDREPLYISPVPGPTDFPLLSLGSRSYMTPTLVATETDLPLNVAEGEVAVAMSTGRVKLSQVDIDKSDPDKATFDKHFLGETLIYGGVALNGTPQPVKSEVVVTSVTANGRTKYFIPDAVTLPTEWVASDSSRGLGVSGVINVPDETGVVPTLPLADVPIRPGGDNLSDTNDGRIRQVFDGISDTIVFSRKKALSVIVVDTEDDVPSSSRIPAGTAYVTRANVTYNGSPRGSLVAWGRADATEFASDPVYFLQTDFLPALHTIKAQVLSKSRFVFRFPEAVTLYFAIDGTGYTWISTNLNDTSRAYTPEEVAADILVTIGAGAGTAYALNGSVVLESDNPTTGSVEIGWGAGGIKDLTGAANLGFLPGWRVVGGVNNWLPDSGISFGMFRSSVNPDRTREAADFGAFERLSDETLQATVGLAPLVFLDAPPLQDVAGYDEGVFFNLKTVVEGPDGIEILDKNLQHYEDVVHRFDTQKFLWAGSGSQTEKLQKATTTLGFGQAGIVPESLLGAPGISGGLYVSEGGAFVFQDPDRDFLLPQDGQAGVAKLIRRFGDLALFGGRGTLTAGSPTFSDSDANFVAASDEQASDPFGNLLFDSAGDPLFLPVAQEGYRLKITSGPAAGNYIVTAVDPGGTDLTVSPTPSIGTDRATPWELFRGFTSEVYDPSIIADMVYEPFNHLPEEPLKVRVLSKLGVIPTDAATQATGRLSADVEFAVSRSRDITLRYGLAASTATNTASLAALAKTKLGVLANNLLAVPSTNDDRFLNTRFAVLIGTVSFVPVGVASFSPDPVGVEYLTAAGADGAKGLLKFNSTLLTNYASSDVYYAEIFLDPADLAVLSAEYDPENGDLNLPTTDLTAHAGVTAWFVERMFTENALDVSVTPMAGSVGFQEPTKEFQVVEVEYDVADNEGRRVAGTSTIEFLPVFVRDEEADRLDDITFEYNVTGREMDLRLTPTVRVGAVVQNFGTVVDMFIEPPAVGSGRGKIRFISKRIPAHIPVLVTFASFEANGGERAYSASQRPLYRPPFFIKKAQDNFGLRTDRSGDFEVGRMLRIGESCHYIRRILYIASADITRLDIFPATVEEVGTRSPGNDVLSLVTSAPITTTVDPDGATPVVTTAPAGFMQAVPVASFPFEPVEKGQKTITFQGDLTQFAVPGHILEVAGMPFTIAVAELNEDGTRTKVTLTNPFSFGVNVSTAPTVKLSYRPVYPPNVRDFLGVNPVINSEPLELVLFGETDSAGTVLAGRTLVREIDWSINTTTGAARLLSPNQDPLGPGQTLRMSFTKVRTLLPYMSQGVVAYPRVFSAFLFNTTPSASNGLLGGLLSATFTYRNPDTFYCRATTLVSFLGEATKQAVDEIKAKQPAGGALKTTVPSDDNWTKGRIGIVSEGRHLYDQDRAARTFLDFYNSAVVAFEQVPETISGGFIGDRDGKFRFFVGKGKAWPTPGYEDAVSGRLTSRFVWGEVFNLANPFADTLVFPGDPVTHPFRTTLTNGVLDGPPPSADLLRTLSAKQKTLVRNDVDDLVLIGVTRPTVQRISTFPYFRYRAGPGIVRSMGTAHRLSRLFPTETRAFLITSPGIGANEATGDPGVYARRRVIDGEERSTYRTEIGQLSNPALGDIENVTQASVYKRRARARIWGYFPDGIATGAFSAGIPAAPIVEPCLVVFPIQLSDVPLDPGTGWPDVPKLLSEGGTVPDAVSGDPDLAIPGFVTGDQISWGKPTGNVYPGLTPENISIAFGAFTFGDRYTSLFVRDVQHGCVIRFQDHALAAITDPANVLVGTAPNAGIVAGDFPIQEADTLIAVAADGGDAVFADPDKPTTSEVLALASRNDTYDVRVQPDGKLIDITLPSFSDPTWWGLKELTGQNPPEPMQTVEADVQFVPLFQNPTELPCLKGEFTDDSGDNQIPYMRGTNTELARFREVSVALPAIVSDEYPDEIFGTDGELVGVANVGDAWDAVPDQHGGGITPLKEAAVLMTTESMTPKADAPTTAGLADLRMYDLLLIETDDTEVNIRSGAQGILSVGDVSSPAEAAGGNAGFVKVPRFVTPTTPPPRWKVALGGTPVGSHTNTTGSPITYVFERFYTFLNASYPADPQVAPTAGVKILDLDTTGDAAIDTTVIDFGDQVVAGTGVPIALNNGVTAGAGNLNDLWDPAGGNPLINNKITIRLYARTDPTIIEVPDGAGGAVLGVPLPPGTLVYSIEFYAGNATFTEHQGGDTNVLVMAPGDVTFGATHPSYAPPAGVVNERQIFIKQGGLAHFDNTVAASKWFLPYSETNPGGAFNQREMLYGLECTISIDTHDAGVLARSDTGWISRDRLTFNEVYDLTHTAVRGTTHPLAAGTLLEGRLIVHEVTTPNGPSIVNRDVNGGESFTFLPLSTSTAPFGGGGQWAIRVNGTNPEQGWIEVPSFEGYATGPGLGGAVPLAYTGVRFACMPSRVADVLSGDGVCESKDDVALPVQDRYDDRVGALTALVGGALSDIEKGDILIIDAAGEAGATADWACTKVGTWPIRYAVAATPAGVAEALEVSPEEVVGSGGGMFPAFPVVQGMTATTLTVGTLTGLVFAAAGRVYVVIDPTKFGDATATLVEFRNALWSATYTSITAVGGQQRFNGLASFLWADGTAATATTLLSQSIGKMVTGFDSIAISVKGASFGLPDDPSVVGWHETVLATKYIHGIRYVNFTAAGGTTLLRDADALEIVDGAPGVGEIGVDDFVPATPWVFDPVEANPVYPNVPKTVHISGLSSAQWDALNNPAGHGATPDTDCLLPNTKVLLGDPVGTEGFAAQGGIFLEPSFPRQVFDLAATGAGNQHVIDSDHSLTAAEVGHRNYNDFDVGGAPATPEPVHFHVRRVRRWHEYEAAIDSFMPLRFAYEIRRGRLVGAPTVSDRGFMTIDAAAFTMDWSTGNPPSATVAVASDVWNDGDTHTGTQLGAFDDPDVNINPGDIFRLLDDNGLVVEEAEIASILGPGRIKLAVPGITSVTPAVGQRFEIFLRQAPVPHEQSMEQLLDLVTFRTVHQTHADYGPEQGGYSPANTAGYDAVANTFFDDHSVTGITTAAGGWSGKGVQAGDILVIDPTPTVPQASEAGAPPKGDRGIDGRSYYLKGGTSALDDNRGFYRVVRSDDTANPPSLTVDPVHSFAGTTALPAVFPGPGHPNEDDLNYAIYPTVSDANWTANGPAGDEEAQNDLRPSLGRSPSASYDTGYVDANDRWHSIRPVSYRILRPNRMFSEEAVDLILTVRERMLSWIEMLRSLFSLERLGDYYRWMEKNHPHNIELRGILTNDYVQSFMGHWNVSPYTNTDDCLSILGRRFWIRDTELDRLEPTTANPATADKFKGRDFAGPPNFPDPGGPYTAYTTDIGGAVLPVLPDRIEEVLDNSDRLRPMRYVWLAYRTHRILGTLASIARFEAELPARLEEQRQLALVQESTDKAELA
jgi:hypothetical protein